MKYLCLYPEEKLYFFCIFCILKGKNKQILLSEKIGNSFDLHLIIKFQNNVVIYT
jgi:hypothetical protein